MNDPADKLSMVALVLQCYRDLERIAFENPQLRGKIKHIVDAYAEEL